MNPNRSSELRQLVVLASLHGLSFWISPITGAPFLKHGNHWSPNGRAWYPDYGIDGDAQATTLEKHYRLVVTWRNKGCPIPNS